MLPTCTVWTDVSLGVARATVPTRSAKTAIAVAAIARVATLGRVGLIPKVCGQLSLEHLLDRRGEQPREEPVFAEEVVQGGCTGQLVLDTFD